MKSKINPYLGFNDSWLLIIGIPLIGILVPIIFYGVDPFSFNSYTLINYIFSIGLTASYWLGDRFILFKVRKRYPGLSNYKSRMLISTVLVLIYTLIVSECGDAIINMLSGKQPIYTFDLTRIYRQNTTSMIVTIGCSFIYEVIYLVYLYRTQLVESEQIKKESLQAQLDALKSQIDPHFLFNSLNTLTAVVPENSDLAVKFVQHLSKVYRYILEIKDQQFISLRDELKSLQSYEFLLNIRFGDNIAIHFNIPEESKQLFIVPLSVQMLLENAIKHNVCSKSHKLKIVVHQKGDRLYVTNNLKKKITKVASTKTGLKNIKSRYQILTKQELDIIETEKEFSVGLPLVQIEEL